MGGGGLGKKSRSNRIKLQRVLMAICPTDSVQQGIIGLIWAWFCRVGKRGGVFEFPLKIELY